MKKLILFLPLVFMHAQTRGADALPGAITVRRAPERSFGGSSASSALAAIQRRVLPRILSDSNWETTVVLFNTGSAPVAFQQFFFASDGSPASYTVDGQGSSVNLTTSAVQAVLAPGSSLTLDLLDASGAIGQGWSLLTYNEGLGMVDGYTIIRRKGSNGGAPSEIAEPFSSMLDYSVYVPFDNTLGFASQLTLVNPSGNLSSQVQLTYLDPQGRVLLIDSLTLQPGRQTTLTLPDTYPISRTRAARCWCKPISTCSR